MSEASFYTRVNEILFYLWDPIGVVASVSARDEYDSYVSGICKILLDGGSQESLVEDLYKLEINDMGLGGNKNNIKYVVGLLFDLKEFYKENEL